MVFMPPDATGCYAISTLWLRMTISMQTKPSGKQTNYIAGLQYWFYPKCRLQAQYTFRDRNKGKDSNLFQAQVQVRF